MKKPPKPSAIYRKPIKARAFEKAYLGLLEHSKDKDFLSSAFDLVEGKYLLKTGLGSAEMKRLNGLAKAIKGNRGAVKTGPLILATILVASAAIFGIFFMNPVLERSLERGLEAAFGARADVTDFRLDLARLRVSMASITVADRDEPMANLFETGRVKLGLSLASLLRGRVYVEEATVASIAVGTPRTSSGALAGSPAKPTAGKPKDPAAPPLVDFENFDARALLEREKAKLGSTAAYAEAQKAYDEATARWTARAESSGKALADLEASSKKVLALDPKTIRTASEALSAAADAKALIGSAGSVARETGAIAKGIDADASAAAALEKKAKAAASDDLDYLKSLVDPKSGAAARALEPSVREILSDKAERWLYYGSRALEVALRLKASSSNDERREDVAAPHGRDVVFPSAALPRFRLGLLSSSFEAEGRKYRFEVRELSSEPDLVDTATSLALGFTGNGGSAAVDAVADLRASSTAAFRVDASAKGLPLDLGDSLASVGLGGLTGIADGQLRLDGEKDGSAKAVGGLSILEPVAGSATGTVGKSLASAIASVDSIKVDVTYDKGASGDGKFSIDTNLDAIVGRALKAVADRYTKDAIAKLESAMRDYVGTELESKLASKGELGTLLAGAKGDDQAASSIDSRLDVKVAAFEARAKELGTGVLQGIGSGLGLPKVKP